MLNAQVPLATHKPPTPAAIPCSNPPWPPLCWSVQWRPVRDQASPVSWPYHPASAELRTPLSYLCGSVCCYIQTYVLLHMDLCTVAFRTVQCCSVCLSTLTYGSVHRYTWVMYSYIWSCALSHVDLGTATYTPVHCFIWTCVLLHLDRCSLPKDVLCHLLFPQMASSELRPMAWDRPPEDFFSWKVVDHVI